MEPLIWFVHGMGATPRSFAWLGDKLGLDADHIAYHHSEPVAAVIARLEARASVPNHRPVIVIGHSLGGLIAAGLMHLPCVRCVVTLAAPLGGQRFAGLMRLFSNEPLFRDLAPYSLAIGDIHASTLAHPKPHLAVVATTGGMPGLSLEPNDGVVTVRSQTAWRSPSYHFVPLNHFELLMAAETAQAISDFVAAHASGPG